jgi:hypothetical protein
MIDDLPFIVISFVFFVFFVVKIECRTLGLLDGFVTAGGGEALAFEDAFLAGGVEPVGGVLGGLAGGEARREHGVGRHVADGVALGAAATLAMVLRT